MNQPDLTPKTYIKKSQTQAAIRKWAAFGLLCLLISAVPVGIEGTRTPDSSAARAQERVALAQARIAQAHSSIEAVNAQLTKHERELQAEEHLTRRPDWSGVMRLVAQQFDQQLMMTGLQLGSVKDSKVRGALGPLAQDVPDDSVWLIISGVAEANSNVPGLIQRLEQLGLFERVVMTGTQRETFSGGARTGFTLACRVE